MSDPRHEAPASEDEARRKLIECIDQWDSEMEYDAEDRVCLADDILHAFNGPPVVSHEAPAEPCFECGSTERTGTACKPCNPEITDPNFGHEAPAEGAGEIGAEYDAAAHCVTLAECHGFKSHSDLRGSLGDEDRYQAKRTNRTASWTGLAEQHGADKL